MILFDTNILVYSQNKQSKYYKNCQSWLRKAHTSQIDAVLSSQNIAEFTSVFLRLPLKQTGLTAKDANKPLASFTSGLFRLIYPTAETITIFQDFMVRYRTDSRRVFDLFLVATMLSNYVTQILTYNGKDFIRYNEIKVVTPE